VRLPYPTAKKKPTEGEVTEKKELSEAAVFEGTSAK